MPDRAFSVSAPSPSIWQSLSWTKTPPHISKVSPGVYHPPFNKRPAPQSQAVMITPYPCNTHTITLTEGWALLLPHTVTMAAGHQAAHWQISVQLCASTPGPDGVASQPMSRKELENPEQGSRDLSLISGLPFPFRVTLSSSFISVGFGFLI